MKRSIMVGCCGWGYLRPSSAPFNKINPKQTLLQLYATIFDTVEINYTFYRIPQKKTALKWRQEVDAVNPKFEFTLKAFQIITHKLRFRDLSLKYFDTLIELSKILNSKIILFQSPPNFLQKEENLKSIENFFNNINRENLILIWEPRGNWDNKIVKEICDNCRILHCVDPLRKYPIILKKQKIVYFRLHGLGEKMYSYKYSQNDLIKLKNVINEIPDSINTIYTFFNNTNCYEDAYRFKEII